jgi:chemotaxis protein histidine kinase CheA
VADVRRIRPEDLAALQAQFVAGLPARAAAMREALEVLSAGASVDAAMRLYIAAHALRGTAQVYGALDLVPHAERLETWSDAWRRDGRAAAAAIAEARRELDLLTAAMTAARQRADARPR